MFISKVNNGDHNLLPTRANEGGQLSSQRLRKGVTFIREHIDNNGYLCVNHISIIIGFLLTGDSCFQNIFNFLKNFN